jgi:signal peptidase II
MKKIILFSLVIFIVDQIVKLFVGFSLALNTSLTIIKNIFYISNVHNYGAAFSILYGNRLFLILVSIFTLIFIYCYLFKNKVFSWLDVFIYSLLIGGILGNLFDRIIYGYVVDYFDFYIFGYNFPIFNIADICIVVSVILIIIDTIRGGFSENKCK